MLSTFREETGRDGTRTDEESDKSDSTDHGWIFEKKGRKGSPGPVVVVVIASCARTKGKETWK
jgi:hypothetical protein